MKKQIHGDFLGLKRPPYGKRGKLAFTKKISPRSGMENLCVTLGFSPTAAAACASAKWGK